MYSITTKQITVKFPANEAEELFKLATKNKLTVAAQVRKLVNKGVSIEAYQDEEAKILSNTKNALRQVLDPQIERIVKITVKNSVASSINLLYTAFLMQRMATDESRLKLEPIMDEARRLGILFVQQAKGSIDDFIRASIKSIEATWEDM